MNNYGMGNDYGLAQGFDNQDKEAVQKLMSSLQKLIQEHHLKCAELSEKELAKCMSEAVLSGDFALHIRTESGHTTDPENGRTSMAYSYGVKATYIPYRELQKSKEPIPETYACQRCGRRDGLDCVVTNDIWDQLSGDYDILCLWCMDELAHEAGITTTASLHFAGRAIVGTSQSETDQDHLHRMAKRIHYLEEIADCARQMASGWDNPGDILRMDSVIRRVRAALESLSCGK